MLMNIRWWIYDEYSLFDPILDPNKFIHRYTTAPQLRPGSIHPIFIYILHKEDGPC
jgi:hypothetical protein